MDCPACGNQVDEVEQACPRCGRTLAERTLDGRVESSTDAFATTARDAGHQMTALWSLGNTRDGGGDVVGPT